MVEKKLVVPAQKVAEVVEKLEVTNPMSLLKEERLRELSPVRRLAPMEEVATTDPLALTESMELVSPVIAKLVVVALEKVVVPKALVPEKVLLSERCVEEAALMVKVPPRVTGMVLIVREPPFTSSELPMVEVETTCPAALVERRLFGRPESVRLVVEAEVK